VSGASISKSPPWLTGVYLSVASLKIPNEGPHDQQIAEIVKPSKASHEPG